MNAAAPRPGAPLCFLRRRPIPASLFTWMLLASYVATAASPTPSNQSLLVAFRSYSRLPSSRANKRPPTRYSATGRPRDARPTSRCAYRPREYSSRSTRSTSSPRRRAGHRMPVEVGSVVKAGDLLAQVDPRDVKNSSIRRWGTISFRRPRSTKAMRDAGRKDSLFVAPRDHGVRARQPRSSLASAAPIFMDRAPARSRAAKLEDATVARRFAGTIISRPVTTGTIISSATAANGGTTLMTSPILAAFACASPSTKWKWRTSESGEHGERRSRCVPRTHVRRRDREGRAAGRSDSGRDVLSRCSSASATRKAVDARHERRGDDQGRRSLEGLADSDRRDSRDQRARAGVAHVQHSGRYAHQLAASRSGGRQGNDGHSRAVRRSCSSDSTYEMRLIKSVPTDLRVTECSRA